MVKLKDYFQLIKFTLSITVVFSSVIAYLLAPNVQFNIKMVLLLTLSGLLITGSANAINQILEKDFDKLMSRTANRPIASGRMTVMHAQIFSAIAGISGLAILAYFFNWQAAALAALSIFLYGFVYTPLKRVSAISVLVGGIPGALPCLIGWLAATNKYSSGGWILFTMQFLWQFPHFWAIAWVAHKDYTKAGYKLLPNQNEPNKQTALQAIGYTLIMIPLGFLPKYFGISGDLSMWVIFAANLAMTIQCIRLYRSMEVSAARRVMFSSYIYLPIVLLVLLADKAH